MAESKVIKLSRHDAYRLVFLMTKDNEEEVRTRRSIQGDEAPLPSSIVNMRVELSHLASLLNCGNQLLLVCKPPGE